MNGVLEMTAFTPPERALEGLSAEQAVRLPPGAPYSIARVLGHLRWWQAWMLRAARGEAMTFPEHAGTGWPEVRASEWEESKAGFLKDLAEARTLARHSEASSRVVYGEDTAEKVLTELALHNAHHLGQIILLRQLIGAWPPPGGDTW